MPYRDDPLNDHRTSNLSFLISFSALFLALFALAGCDIIDGGDGGGDAGDAVTFDVDGDVTAEKVLCSPKYPERPKDCRIDKSLTIRKTEDFKELCNSKCQRFSQVEVRLTGARDPLLARVETLPPLRGFKRAYSSLELDGRSNLEDLSFLRDLNHAGNLRIRRNASLENLEGLDSLETIASKIALKKNSALRNLQGIDTLKRVGYVDVRKNPNLESLEALEDVTVSDKDFRSRGVIIRKNKSLKNLDGLQGVTVLEQNLTIFSNKSLQSLKGLENLKRVEGGFRIENNPNLPSCEAQNLVDRVETSPRVTIQNNDKSASCD